MGKVLPHNLSLEMTMNKAIFIIIIMLMPIASKAEVQSSITLAIDYSGSYIADREKGELDEIYKFAFDLISKAAQRMPKDISFKSLAISEKSSIERVDCQAMGMSKGLFGKSSSSDPNSFIVESRGRNQSPFRQYLETICLSSIKQRVESPGTDISGTLDLAIKLGREESSGPKLLVMLSDFYEYRDDFLPEFEFNLEDFHVLLVYRSTYSENQSGGADLTYDEAVRWKGRLESSGAERVHIVDERSTLSITKVLRNLF